MNKKTVFIAVVLFLALGGAFVYRFTHLKGGAAEQEHAGHAEERGHQGDEKHGPEAEGEHEGEHGEKGEVKMTADLQRQNGVQIAQAQKRRLGGMIRATGKVEANADRIAHVSPRISGKIVAVRASLGENVAAGEPLATLDSVELGEALSRYRQSRTRVTLAQSNMERVKTLVEKKIAARKEILQAETEFKSAQAELYADEERLSLYGVALSELRGEGRRKVLLPVRSPIAGVITEKHAIVGEFSDPSKSLYTVADLSSVWVLVDVNETDLAKVHKGQPATVSVGAFPDLKLRGRVTYIADLVDEATRTVKARVEVANPGRRLKPEMFATVELALPDDSPAVLAVPEDALQEIKGQKVLFVTEDGTGFEPRPVALGRASGGMAEVVSGLKEGERYAAKGSFLLKSELQKGELGEHGH